MDRQLERRPPVGEEQSPIRFRWFSLCVDAQRVYLDSLRCRYESDLEVELLFRPLATSGPEHLLPVFEMGCGDDVFVKWLVRDRLEILP